MAGEVLGLMSHAGRELAGASKAREAAAGVEGAAKDAGTVAKPLEATPDKATLGTGGGNGTYDADMMADAGATVAKPEVSKVPERIKNLIAGSSKQERIDALSTEQTKLDKLKQDAAGPANEIDAINEQLDAKGLSEEEKTALLSQRSAQEKIVANFDGRIKKSEATVGAWKDAVEGDKSGVKKLREKVGDGNLAMIGITGVTMAPEAASLLGGGAAGAGAGAADASAATAGVADASAPVAAAVPDVTDTGPLFSPITGAPLE